MRKTAFIFIPFSSLFLILAPLAFSVTEVNISNNEEGAKSNVDVKTNTGNNTVCINGKCTTSEGGSGKSTVCINGNCQTSEGNINMQSEDGNSKVNIQNNGNSSVNVEQKSESNAESRVEVRESVQGAAITEESKKEPEKATKKPGSKNVEEEKFEIAAFIKEKLESLRKIISLQFLFGDK